MIHSLRPESEGMKARPGGVEVNMVWSLFSWQMLRLDEFHIMLIMYSDLMKKITNLGVLAYPSGNECLVRELQSTCMYSIGVV